MRNQLHVANDNEKLPLAGRAKRAAIGFARPSPRISTLHQRTFGQTSNVQIVQSIPAPNAKSQTGIFDKLATNMVALLVWICCVVALILFHGDMPLPLPKIALAIVFGWASLFLLAISKRQNRAFYKTLGVLGAVLSLAIIGYDLYASFNIQLSGGLSLCLGAALTLALGALTREKFPVVLSAGLTALWVGLSAFDQNASQLIWLFPTLFVLQYYLSTKMKSPTALTLTCLSALGWIGALSFALVQSAQMPAVLALGLALLFGLTYHRIGKTLQDTKKQNGLLHTYIAWGVSAMAALSLQIAWNTSDTQFVGNSLEAAPFIGYAISALLVVILTLICFARTRSGYQSRIETVSLFAAAALLTTAINTPDLLTAQISKLSAAPTQIFSFVLGGLIAATCVGAVINGARRGLGLMILAGIIALLAELYLILPQIGLQAEAAYFFGYSFLFSILFLALFAQHSINRASSFRSRFAANA